MLNITEPQLAQDTDPFVLSFAGIDYAAPYPFIGNGYIGYQVPREGQGINGIPPNQIREKWHNNTTYFLTGLGGFLQLFINGFAGLRIRENGFVVNPCIPQQIGNHIVLRGLHYHGVGFDMIVTNQGRVYVSETGLGIEFTTAAGERIQPYPITEFAAQGQDVVHSLHETLLAQQAQTAPVPEVPLQPEAEGGYQFT